MRLLFSDLIHRRERFLFILDRRRLENEMQHNCVYNKNDEKRVLDEITSMKRGIQLLNEFELKKTMHSDLIDKLKFKKTEKNTSWTTISALNNKQTSFKDTLKTLKESSGQTQNGEFQALTFELFGVYGA
jgi:hypothetical protein